MHSKATRDYAPWAGRRQHLVKRAQQEVKLMKFRKGEWVQSARFGSKGPFVGQIVDFSQGDYIVRDVERRRWLRKEGELSPAAKKEAA